MNIAIAKKRIGQVLRIDSIDSTESDFLATHVPFRNIVVSTKSETQFKEANRSEEDIYKDIFDNAATSEQHQFVIVEGSSGAGKSHFIRWIHANIINREDDNDVVLLIRRSDNTLKGTIKQLLDIKEVREIANKDAYERLVKANQAITEAKFKSTIYHRFKLREMLLLDALTCNYDRHLNNIQFLVNSDSFEIIGLAPVFDNGMGLCSHCKDENIEVFIKYGIDHVPFAYYSFDDHIPQLMSKEMYNRLDNIKDFSFVNHNDYPVSDERLTALNGFIQNRINRLLEIYK